MAHSQTSSLAAFLFTDIVDSTGLKSRLGDSGYARVLRLHDEILDSSLTQQPSGRNDFGDGLLLVLPTPTDAVRTALEFQHAWSAEPELEGIGVRTAIHLGELSTLETPGGNARLAGLHLDICARVLSLADGGQILMTREAMESARQYLLAHPASGEGLQWVEHGPYRLKGVARPVDVCEVGSKGATSFEAPRGSEKATRMTPPPEPPTDAGFGPYKIEGVIGEGGSSRVYRARHTGLARTVALKVIPLESDARVRQFETEGPALAKLDHPGIVRVFDAGVQSINAQPCGYIATELIEGEPIGSFLRDARTSGAAARETLGRVCDAVAYAHRSGIAHGDIRAQNVLVEPNGSPKLVDFGFAIAASDGSSASERLVEADVVMLAELCTTILETFDENTPLNTVGVTSAQELATRLRSASNKKPVWMIGVIAVALVGCFGVWFVVWGPGRSKTQPNTNPAIQTDASLRTPENGEQPRGADQDPSEPSTASIEPAPPQHTVPPASPLAQISIEMGTDGTLFIRGPVLHERDRDAVLARLRPGAVTLVDEVTMDPAAVRRAVENACATEGIQGTRITVRQRPNWGEAYLDIRVAQPDVETTRALAGRFVMDPNDIRVTQTR